MALPSSIAARGGGQAMEAMTCELLRPSLLLGVLSTQTLIVALSASLFIKNANHHRIVMTDILYLVASIGFFGLMLLFIWACEKV